MMKQIKVSVPGRICLFGEHQDYLGLPVITSAIDLAVNIEGHATMDQSIRIDLPDIGSSETIELAENGKEIKYIKERDYFRSVINVLHRQGIQLNNGCDCRVRGNIPINSGTSSSSALTVAWVRFLMELAEHTAEDSKNSMQVAHFAHSAEVSEFAEPGGMMDHFATAVGGTLYITFNGETEVKQLSPELGAFVLGDSGQPKDTKYVLHHVKKNVQTAVEKLQDKFTGFNLAEAQSAEIEKFRPVLSEDEQEVFYGALINKEITQKAKKLLEQNFDHKQFGELLTKHHEILDKKLNISTDKINHMIYSAIDAGAYGGKINGSGGGGCMFVYAPENTAKVARAIESAGGKAFIVHVGEGLKVRTK
ncbi:MAG: GHMP kinase [Calditrichaeota bacterium]|nr:GHMP kinase [Calditrichota bacterium]